MLIGGGASSHDVKMYSSTSRILFKSMRICDCVSEWVSERVDEWMKESVRKSVGDWRHLSASEAIFMARTLIRISFIWFFYDCDPRHQRGGNKYTTILLPTSLCSKLVYVASFIRNWFAYILSSEFRIDIGWAILTTKYMFLRDSSPLKIDTKHSITTGACAINTTWYFMNSNGNIRGNVSDESYPRSQQFWTKSSMM